MDQTYGNTPNACFYGSNTSSLFAVQKLDGKRIMEDKKKVVSIVYSNNGISYNLHVHIFVILYRSFDKIPVRCRFSNAFGRLCCGRTYTHTHTHTLIVC